VKLLQLCRNQWDRTAAVVLVLAGLVALVSGWIGASDTVLSFEQIPYLISGGLAGMCLIVLGSAAWLSADLRDEWRKLDSLEEAFREVDVRTPAPPVIERPEAGPGAETAAAPPPARSRQPLGLREA
jgi:hypothetical protein